MKIVIDQHGIVVVDGGNGIEQRRHEIGFRIPNAGGVLADTVHDLFDVHGGDLFKALLHEAGGILRIPPDLDRGAAVHSNLQHNLHQLIKLHPVILLTENVVFDLLSDLRFFLKPVRHSVRRRQKE